MVKNKNKKSLKYGNLVNDEKMYNPDNKIPSF